MTGVDILYVVLFSIVGLLALYGLIMATLYKIRYEDVNQYLDDEAAA